MRQCLLFFDHDIFVLILPCFVFQIMFQNQALPSLLVRSFVCRRHINRFSVKISLHHDIQLISNCRLPFEILSKHLHLSPMLPFSDQSSSEADKTSDNSKQSWY